MKREEVEKLASKYQAKADKDFEAYQGCGLSRYLNSYHKNEDLATALRMAAGAADERQAYINLKLRMAEFARRAQRIQNTKTEIEKDIIIESLIEDIIQYSILEGFIGEI